MTETKENTVILKKTKTKVKATYAEFVKDNLIWSIAGFAMELGASSLSAAPSSSALAAGLSGGKCFSVLFGGIFGALLHGLPDGLINLSGMAIILAARLIPDMRNSKLRAALRALAAALACFFPRSAEVTEPSQLIFTIIAAVAAGVFAACVSLISESVSIRGFDISEPRDCAKAAVITALGFMALGVLDYPFLNIGRLALGFLLLAVTARRGLAYCAVFGLSALGGLCAANADIGRGAAAVCFAVVVSCFLTKYGKLTRAAGFVFFCCSGALVGGIDEGNWSLVIEAAAAGILFVVLPVEKARSSEKEFSDSTIAMMLRERLCFAADAIAGIGTGLSAAADTLDRKYGATLEQAAERAADRACKTCPNSMTCWGEKYEQFRGEFERLMKCVRSGEEINGGSLSAECAEDCKNGDIVARSVMTEYKRYLSAAADEQRIKELRRIYTDQLEGVHDILRDMGCMGRGSLNKSAERRVEKLLRESGMEGAKAFVSVDKQGRMFLEAYGDSEPRVDRSYLGELLIGVLGRELELPQINAGGPSDKNSAKKRWRLTAQERCTLSAEIGAFQLSRGKNRVCGDCYDSFTDAQGALYIVLSDGMGSGSRARIDSAMACSVISRLLKGGFTLSAALETVNTVLMVKSTDESFATLDICKIDLNTGECAVYKAGAATTYIKSADKLLRASLSSPPAGMGGKLTVPAQKFTVSAGDKIIMTTDGAVLDEEWLSRELSSDTPAKELSEKIARAARAAENGREDDISVIAVTVGR